MAIRNYTTGKTKINFSINTCPPKMTDDEYNARADKWDEFVLNIKAKYQDDLTNKQIRDLGLVLKNIVVPFQSGYLNFSPDEVLKIDTENAKSMLSTLKAFRDTYQEQKDSLEQGL